MSKLSVCGLPLLFPFQTWSKFLPPWEFEICDNCSFQTIPKFWLYSWIEIRIFLLPHGWIKAQCKCSLNISNLWMKTFSKNANCFSSSPISDKSLTYTMKNVYWSMMKKKYRLWLIALLLSPWDCKKVSRQKYHALGAWFNLESAFKSKHILFSFPFSTNPFNYTINTSSLNFPLKKIVFTSKCFIIHLFYVANATNVQMFNPLNNRGKCFIKVDPLVFLAFSSHKSCIRFLDISITQ